jgi:hypothetical protein
MKVPLGIETESIEPAAILGSVGTDAPMDSLAGGGGPGHFKLPLGADFADPSDRGAEQLQSGSKVKAKELNVAGEFAWSNPNITEAEEVQELQAGRWMPQTDDFVAIAGGTVPVAPTFGNLLGAILQQPDGGISRLNLFSHSNKSLVAFGGHIEKRSVGRADVFLNVNGTGDNMTAMDPTSMANLSQAGVTFQAPKPIGGKKDFTVDDVRKKFAANASIVLYLCHSGQDTAFLKSIATFFRVKVIGFSDVVGYYPPAQTSATRFQRNGEKVGVGFGGTPTADFRTLINDPKAVTATP